MLAFPFTPFERASFTSSPELRAFFRLSTPLSLLKVYERYLPWINTWVVLGPPTQYITLLPGKGVIYRHPRVLDPLQVRGHALRLVPSMMVAEQELTYTHSQCVGSGSTEQPALVLLLLVGAKLFLKLPAVVEWLVWMAALSSLTMVRSVMEELQGFQEVGRVPSG